MKQRQLASTLRAVGAESRRRDPSSHLRTALLFLGVFIIGISLLTLVAVGASYQGRESRGLARTPVEASSDQGPTVLYYSGGDSVGYRTVQVIYVVPLVPDAPLPPGLDRWPQEGEATLSPQLLIDGAGEGIGTRYGRSVGHITDAGLVDPTERLVYVHPTAASTADSVFTGIVGFGSSSGAPQGPALYDRAMSDLLLIVAVLLLAPGVVALMIGARIGSESRDRRLRLLEVLGISPAQRRLVVFSELRLPLLWAVGAAGLLALMACLANVRVPGAQFVLVAADMRRDWYLLVAALALCLVASVAGVLLADRTRGLRSQNARRLEVQTVRVRPVAISVFVVTCFLTANIDGFFPRDALILAYGAGALIAVLTLPAVIAAMMVLVGRVAVWVGRRTGSAASIVSGRRLTHLPTAATRLASAIAIALVLLVSAQVWLSKLAEPATAARDALAAVGSSMLTVTPPAGTTTLTAFEAGLPDDVMALALVSPAGSPDLRLQGSCNALTIIDLPCSDVPQNVNINAAGLDPRVAILAGRGPQLASMAGPSDGSVAPGENLVGLVLVSRSGDISIPAIREQLAQQYAPSGYVDSVGGATLEGATILVDQSRWVGYFGTVGILVLAAGTLISAGAYFLRFSQILAPLSVMSTRPSLFWTSAAWQIAAPFTIAAVLGAGIAIWLASPLTTPAAGGTLPTALILKCVVGIAAVGIGLSAAAASMSMRRAVKWKPGATSATVSFRPAEWRRPRHPMLEGAKQVASLDSPSQIGESS